MATLQSLIEVAHERMGLPLPGEQGWRPADAGLDAVLEALEQDDLAGAVSRFEEVTRGGGSRDGAGGGSRDGAGTDSRDNAGPGSRESAGDASENRGPGTNPTGDADIVREAILVVVDGRARRLDDTIAHETQIARTASGAIGVLNLRIAGQRFERDPQLMRITWIAAVIILSTTVLSVLRFGLSYAVALGGVVAFAAAAILLWRVDLKRQREEFDVQHALDKAAVAEETQILEADARTRMARVRELDKERGELIDIAMRLANRKS